MIHVAIPIDPFVEWGGGLEYILNFIMCLCIINEKKGFNFIKIIVIIEHETKKHKIFFNRIQESGFEVEYYFKATDASMKTVLEEIRADVCFPVLSSFYRGTEVPQIIYIPDLQEEHLPQFFSYNEILERRKRNSYFLSKAKYVLISSETVKKDIEYYYNKPNVTYFILPCLPLSNRKYWNTFNVDLSKYTIPNHYYIVSNQFWKHKDHITVFKAINYLINSENKNVRIICTGKMEDFRNPEYIDELTKYIKDNELSNNIILLGYINREEQLEIMKRSDGIIQATLFEGGAGGFSAQEAIAYGKRVILSDIDINKELKDFKNVYYFKHGDYLDLANRIQEIGIDSEPYSIDETLKIYNMHTEKLSNYYLNIIKKVINNE